MKRAEEGVEGNFWPSVGVEEKGSAEGEGDEVVGRSRATLLLLLLEESGNENAEGAIAVRWILLLRSILPATAGLMVVDEGGKEEEASLLLLLSEEERGNCAEGGRK